MRQEDRKGSLSDQLYNWSDIIAFLLIVNPFCYGPNQILKLEQAPRLQNWRRFNQVCVRTKQGLVGPIAGNRQTASIVVVKTQDFPSADVPDLENGEALSFERMKRMGDQVVQAALRNVIEPIFERDFAAQSYGFRPGRGSREALRRVEELLKEGNYWVVDADIKGYFDSIPHKKLMEKIGKKISDGRVLKLIESYLQAGVMETGKGWEATPEGTPQGGVISPLLANIYLDELDWELARAGLQMVRYADDFAVLSRTEKEAYRALELCTRT